MKKLSTEEFIKRAKEIHGDKYDYSITNYVNRRTKIKYICPIHGIQEQLPENHIKYGCGQCGIDKASIKRRVPIENLIKRFNEVHNNKYDYSKMNYVNIDTPIEIICPEHGSFFQSPYDHQRGANCPKCGGRKKTTEDFIKCAKEIHGDKYDYSKSKYINSTTKIEIICPEHGSFFQSYVGHILLKQNCPVCSKTTYKGEEKISNYLKAMKIEFETQKTFEDCKDKRCLKFDFFIPKQNLIIEYDGIQHFSPTSFGNDADYNLKYNVKHDKIKEEYCKKNNLKLLRISYEDFDNIEEILHNNISTTFIMTWPKDFDKEKYAINILNSLGDFPYDTYQDKELLSDYSKISSSPNSLAGLKIVKNFHKNIYSSRVGSHITPVEAWNDKELLLKTILNRMTYHKPPYTPKVIRDGLNISKKAPKVSVFKPSLARFLIENFLNEFNTVFDPFSGFSGRMLGCCSLGKKYIGQDINQEQVLYSNQIINLLKLDATVIQKDIFESNGEYDCLFTCSPYNLKEVWNDNETNLSCDEWIEVCLKTFKCKRYLFVVDKTEQFKEHIVYEITNRSHLSSNTEKVILL